jgi:adenine-specific DNA-methyltransferase
MRYYGCKEKLLDFIAKGVYETGINHGSIFCDLFTGTTAVAKYFKKKGYTVYANDFLNFSYCLAKAYIESKKYPSFSGLREIIPGLNSSIAVNRVVEYLNCLKPINGFIYKNYCPGGTQNLDCQRMYFTDINGKKIDAIRTTIEEWRRCGKITDNEFYILLASLIEAIPYVANISGNYAAYLKHWDPRTRKILRLKVPEISFNKNCNKAYQKDANILIRNIRSDILYLDPPYNGRQYAANYFLLELIAEGWFDNKPQIYGKTGMRSYNDQKSKFCQKSEVFEVFADIISSANTRYILLSYNDEGLLTEDEIISILNKRGNVKVFRKIHRRYRSINQDSSDRQTVYEKLYFVKVKRN